MTTNDHRHDYDDDTPKVWVSTLGAYNSGVLIGRWVSAADAPTTVTAWLGTLSDEDVRRAGELGWDLGDELWCFDHEGFGGLLSGECPPERARALAELHDELISDGVDVGAFAAYADLIGEDPDVIDVDEFRSAFCGEWDSLEDFADDQLDEVRSFMERETVMGWAARYLDAKHYAHELKCEGYGAVTTNDGWSVHVFRP